MFASSDLAERSIDLVVKLEGTGRCRSKRTLSLEQKVGNQVEKRIEDYRRLE